MWPVSRPSRHNRAGHQRCTKDAQHRTRTQRKTPLCRASNKQTDTKLASKAKILKFWAVRIQSLVNGGLWYFVIFLSLISSVIPFGFNSNWIKFLNIVTSPLPEVTDMEKSCLISVLRIMHSLQGLKDFEKF